MILSYKQKFPWGRPTNFEQKIKEGIKKHTIRDDIHGRWKPGMMIQHAHGVRTSNYRCFAEGQCMSVQVLEIKAIHSHEYKLYHSEIKVLRSILNGDDKIIFELFVDGRQLNGAEIHDFARNDGFDATEDFFRWFNEPCTKKIIHFTDFKY